MTSARRVGPAMAAGGHSLRGRTGPGGLSVPIPSRKRKAAAPAKVHGVDGRWPVCAARLLQHCGCLAPRPSWEPGHGRPHPKPSVGPSPWGVPTSPTRGGRVRRLPPGRPAWAWPGQGLSLWRKQRCLSCREHATGGTFRRRTRGGKEPGPRASRSGKSWDSSWGRQVTNRRQAGQQTEQGRSTGAQEGTAGGASPPHAQRGGPGFQGALRQREETRHRNRGVRAWWSFSEGLLGDATGTVIPGLALLDNWSWAGPGEPAQLNRPFPGS